MNYEDELGARKSARNETIEGGRVIVRYALFYCAVIFILSFYSYLLDFLFYKIDYGSIAGVNYPPFQYMIYYIIYGFMVFPLSLLYNYTINYFNPPLPLKFAYAIISCIIAGAVLSRNFHFGYYIGEYRPLKNIIVLMLTGVTIEILRKYVVKGRIEKKLSADKNTQANGQ